MTRTEFSEKITFSDGSTAELEMAADKSWKSFTKYFTDAKDVLCVIYSHSPQFIHQMFQTDAIDLETLEVMVGNNQYDDYRRSLKNTANADKIAMQLERRRRDGDLRIYTIDSNRILLHSKLYIIENHDGSRTLLCGSANLSKQAWDGAKQTNVNIAWHTDGTTPIDNWFEHLYAYHKDLCEPFMEDLTNELEDADTSEEKAECLELWLGGDEFADSPSAELHSRLLEAIDNADTNVVNVADEPDKADETVALIDENDPGPTEITPDNRVRLSTSGIETAVKKNKDALSAHNIRFDGGELVATPASLSRYKEAIDDYPVMNVDREAQTITMEVDNTTFELTASLPDDPKQVNDTLALIEQYIETVGTYGKSRTKEETRAHFFEGVIYFCWAPFANYCAHHYASYDSAELDKDLPYLFLHGRNDSGKGQFLRFGARLISNNYVVDVATGSNFDKDTVENRQVSNTVFPYIVDDIEKTKLKKDIVKSYWESGWDGTVQMPTMIFSSNDSTKPRSELKTRMKTLDFNVNFGHDDLEGDEREHAAELSQQAGSCNLFAWFAHRFFQQDIDLPGQSDSLEAARVVFRELYEYADREPPTYVPLEGPAEQQYDPGRRKWLTALEDGKYIPHFKKDGRVVNDFSGHFSDGKNLYQYSKSTPANIHASVSGLTVEFESADSYRTWIDTPGLVGSKAVYEDGADRPNEEMVSDRAGESVGVIERVKQLFG